MSTTTDKPTVDGIRERSKFQRHLVKPSWGEIDFLLAEVGRRDKELDELRDCDMCEICEDHHV